MLVDQKAALGMVVKVMSSFGNRQMVIVEEGIMDASA